MSYRKLKADYLFDGFQVLPSGSVLICDQEGKMEGIVDENEAGGDLEIYQGMIVPGFINCHCHLELSHLKGRVPEKQGLVSFVLSVMSERFLSYPSRELDIQNAEKDMLNNGIVAVGDICNTGDTIPEKKAKRLAYYNFIELLGWAPALANMRFESGRKLAQSFLNAGSDENHLSLNPHAPYSVSPDLWDLMAPGFKNKTITIHNQETAAENDFFTSASGDMILLYRQMKVDNSDFKAPGTTSLQYYLSRLKEAGRILLVHNTYMTDPDLTAACAFSENLFLCLCPNANLYIENRLPDIPHFMRRSAKIVLGTDSLASNHQLNILEEIKSIRKYFPAISSEEMLVWATSNGAKALSFDTVLGDFKKGKKPGVVLIENLEGGEIGGSSRSRRIV